MDIASKEAKKVRTSETETKPTQTVATELSVELTSKKVVESEVAHSSQDVMSDVKSVAQ